MKKLILISALTVSAIGCGGKDPFQRGSNPLEAYPGLEDSVPPHDVKPRNQYYVSDVFDIAFDEQQDSRKILNFVEGQQATHKIRARVYMDGIGFTLKAHNLPEGAGELTKDAEEGVWTLSWKPKFGFIPAGKKEKQWDIQIELVPTDALAKNSLPEQIERTVNFSLVVRHTEQEPTIVGIKGLEGEVSESGPVKFKVTVADPASYQQRPPVLTWGYDQNLYSNDSKKQKVFSGQAGIDWDYENLKPKQLQNGQWEYSLVYHPKVVAELHRKNAENGTVKVQFSFQAASQASEELSPAYSHPLNIVLKSSGGAQ